MRVQLHAHFLADWAEANADSTFDVKRAGVTELDAPTWPAIARLRLITRLELDVEAAAILHHMSVRIWHQDAGELTAWRQPIAAKVKDINAPIFINVLGQVEFAVPGPGPIRIEAGVDEMLLPVLRLTAVTLPGSGRLFVPQPRLPFTPHGPGRPRRRRKR